VIASDRSHAALETQAEPVDLTAAFHAHGRMLARLAARYEGPDADLEDIIQDVFLLAQRDLRRFRGQSRISTWLYLITLNVIRKRRRRRRVLSWVGLAEASHVEDEEPAPAELLARKQESVRLYRALDRLSERDRTMIVMFDLEGKTGAQVAELLGAKLATVWVWRHRAQSALLKQLSKLDATMESP
jgi:RNA polymerase sigma-70 factor (ECF subfamily)